MCVDHRRSSRTPEAPNNYASNGKPWEQQTLSQNFQLSFVHQMFSTKYIKRTSFADTSLLLFALYRMWVPLHNFEGLEQWKKK